MEHVSLADIRYWAYCGPDGEDPLGEKANFYKHLEECKECKDKYDVVVEIVKGS